MSGRVIVLGGAGQFGRAAAHAFKMAGWQVASLVRGSSAARAAPGTEIIEMDARDAGAVVAAAEGADIVVHALNVSFARWPQMAMPFAEAAIGAARAAGATLMLPGSLYNYGVDLPPRIDETTPMRPSSRKGRIRVEIETRLAEASSAGLHIIVLRAGDFFGGEGGGSWFDRVVIRDIAAGRLSWPGPLEVRHEWAYLPDLAQALVRLAEQRARLDPFATFGFSGHAVTGRVFTDTISRVCRREFKVGLMPWRLLRVLAPIVPAFRELSEIAYLWTKPHEIDAARLRAMIGDLPHTPLDQAIAAALYALGFRARSA